MKPQATLKKLGACPKAVEWAAPFRTQQEAWDACERPDWMLWYLGQMVDKKRRSRRQLVLLACKCARTALKYVPKGEKRPREAIKTAEAWANGDPGVSLKDVRYAANAAYAAYAYAAAYAANAADDAAYAANAAAYAAYDAAYADARYRANKRMCKLIRTEVPYIRRATR